MKKRPNFLRPLGMFQEHWPPGCSFQPTWGSISCTGGAYFPPPASAASSLLPSSYQVPYLSPNSKSIDGLSYLYYGISLVKWRGEKKVFFQLYEAAMKGRSGLIWIWQRLLWVHRAHPWKLQRKRYLAGWEIGCRKTKQKRGVFSTCFALPFSKKVTIVIAGETSVSKGYKLCEYCNRWVHYNK